MVECLEKRCIGPPVRPLTSWDFFNSNLRYGLNSFKSHGVLEGIYKKSFENFLDCINEESERIDKFYKNKGKNPSEPPKLEESKKILGELDFLNVQCSLMKYSQEQDKDNPEKFYCKLIADLKNASEIILGKEKGQLGNYEKTFKNVINHFEFYSSEKSWDNSLNKYRL